MYLVCIVFWINIKWAIKPERDKDGSPFLVRFIFDIFRVKSLSYQGASVAPVTVLIEYIFYRGVRGDTGR